MKNLALLARALGTTAAALLAAAEAEAPPLPIVALLGLRGAGKTTVGKRLARRLRVPFVELDRKVEEAAGLALAEIFALHGEDYYRRLERGTLERLLDESRPMVLACGGGLVTAGETWALLRRRALTVWLRAQAGGPLEPRGAAGRPAAHERPPAGHERAAPAAARPGDPLRRGRPHRGHLAAHHRRGGAGRPRPRGRRLGRDGDRPRPPRRSAH